MNWCKQKTRKAQRTFRSPAHSGHPLARAIEVIYLQNGKLVVLIFDGNYQRTRRAGLEDKSKLIGSFDQRVLIWRRSLIVNRCLSILVNLWLRNDRMTNAQN